MNRLDEQAERELLRADARDEELAAGYMPPDERKVLAIATREPVTAEAEPAESLGLTLRALVSPLTEEEIEAGKIPHPHVFHTGRRGIFPVREVTIIGARGREGKTTVMTAVAAASAMGRTLAGLYGQPSTTVIYSAEDDRSQYARKIGAQLSLLAGQNREAVRTQVLVPDLDHPSYTSFRELVMVIDRQPMPTAAVDAIIEALQPLTAPDAPAPLRTIVFETASTLSDAEEDNRGHKVFIAALKRIARALDLAVVLIHHTSQAADNNLADMTITTADIRGGTSLVFNARQVWLLVNLGSDPDPFPANDARTVLRHMVCDGDMSAQQHRMLALVCLDSSKSAEPPPLFFRWVETDYDPAAVEHEAPLSIAGKPWRKVHEMVKAERATARAEARQEAKREQASESVRLVVDLVRQLQLAGGQPTAGSVSKAAQRSNSWAQPHLAAAAAAGLLQISEERVPRTQGLQIVYRLADYPASIGESSRGTP